MRLDKKVARLKAKAEGPVELKDLADIRKVKINHDLPVEERLKDYIHQIKNPYVYKCGNTIVRIKFNGDMPIEACIAHALSNGF
jgi:hypothetical protein